jgi:hypothetical protein
MSREQMAEYFKVKKNQIDKCAQLLGISKRKNDKEAFIQETKIRAKALGLRIVIEDTEEN